MTICSKPELENVSDCNVVFDILSWGIESIGSVYLGKDIAMGNNIIPGGCPPFEVTRITHAITPRIAQTMWRIRNSMTCRHVDLIFTHRI